MSRSKSSLTSEAILEFVNKQSDFISRREIADHFHIKGGERVHLKILLKELVENHSLLKKGKAYHGTLSVTQPSLKLARKEEKQNQPNQEDLLTKKTRRNLAGTDLKSARPQRQAGYRRSSIFLAVEVVGLNNQGEPLLKPLEWPYEGEEPTLILGPCQAAPASGEKILVKFRDSASSPLVAEFVRPLRNLQERILGTFQKTAGAGTLLPANRKENRSFFIGPLDTMGAVDGDLIEVEILRLSRGSHAEARVVKNFGPMGEGLSPTIIAIKTYSLADTFSEEALTQANQGRVPSLKGRVDLRHLPLVTIDDEDARDFDDAIYAEPDEDKKNPGGWIIWVAIADVSFYVSCDSALDKEAFERGNSVYFPDRVVPMLPEHLSNTICSLKPDEERACLAVRMQVDGQGLLRDFTFMRGLMKSAGRLTYRLAQEALDGKPTSYPIPLIKQVLAPLYEAYKLLRKARTQRGALNIERVEERIYLDSKGHVTGVSPRPHYKSHEIVEEMMILANVAAAVFLTDNNTFSLFRVHDQPDPEKIYELAEFLKPLGLKLAKGQVIRPQIFNKLLLEAKKTPYAFAIQELVLRTQARAVYSPINIGHYGLNLPRYMHFTSPIRRYADLIVHRAILSVLSHKSKKEKAAYPYDIKRLEGIADHISLTERNAAKAERETIERFVAGYLSTKIGEVFDCRIINVTDFGLFVEILNNGAQGLIPFHLMPSDYYNYDRKNHCLRGRRHKHNVFKLGDFLKGRLEETNPLAGSILLSIVESGPVVSKEKKKLSKAPRSSKLNAPLKKPPKKLKRKEA